MTFGPRNAYYLRISTNAVLPLFVYLDERHIDWMSDVVLQHVLADLRPLVIPKLHAEKDIHFGPGASPGTKRGTVEVHRGETYQFAYFFRKTEPHTILLKSRHFVTAPFRPEAASKAVSRSTDRRKRSRVQVSVQQGKRKRARTKETGGFSQSHLDEGKWTAEASEEDTNTGSALRESRPVRQQRRSIANIYQEENNDEEEDSLQDAAMSPPPETGGGPSGDPGVPVSDDGGAAAWDASGQPSPSSDDELFVEEEERKPKPLLQLRYLSFSISGHCLCVVVEPWPPQHQETRLRSAGLRTSSRGGSLEWSSHPSNEFAVAGQRAKTPLFLPEDDRAASEAPFGRERTLPLLPLFHDGIEDHDHSDDDLMNFSQSLNAAGHMHAVAADDDDIDGTALFGDADEARELF